MKTPKIFISHSSRDKALAGLVANLVCAAFGLEIQDIRCTSDDLYQLKAGEKVSLTLRKEVVKAKAFIVLVSPSSMESTYVLFEMGARWGTKKNFFPILAPSASYDLLGSPLSHFHTPFALKDAQNLYLLVRALSDSTGMVRRDPAEYVVEIESILEFTADQALPEGAEEGVVSRDDLRGYRARLPGEVFAVELLTRDVQLARRPEDGKMLVTIDRRGVKECLITNRAKSKKVAEYVTANKPELLRLDKEIQQFLLGKSSEQKLSIQLRNTRLRWASGGVLSIVRFRGKEWVPLFFRDIHPYGWNLSLGQPERQFDPERAGYDVEQELNQPWNYISREFLEETMVLDRTPAQYDRPCRRAFDLKFAGPDYPMKIAADFATQHNYFRQIEDGLNIQEEGAERIAADICDTNFCLTVIDDKGKLHERENVLICFSLLDLGVEVVTVVKYSLNDNDYLLDGEILVDNKKGIRELVRMPIALMSCSYLDRVFGRNSDWFQYTRGPEPSVEIQESPDPTEVHLFDWDIKQRMVIVDGERRGEWKEQRYIDWFDKFRENFFGRDGSQSLQNLSRLFVPGTAKILNVYFTLHGTGESEQ